MFPVNVQVRYRSNTPLVLRGITCSFEAGQRVGVVGRTGSGKTTLISSLFRLVEPSAGTITVDGLDISTIGLHDLRSRLSIIPQEPALFRGTVRFNMDPLGEHTDEDVWMVSTMKELLCSPSSWINANSDSSSRLVLKLFHTLQSSPFFGDTRTAYQ